MSALSQHLSLWIYKNIQIISLISRRLQRLTLNLARAFIRRDNSFLLRFITTDIVFDEQEILKFWTSMKPPIESKSFDQFSLSINIQHCHYRTYFYRNPQSQAADWCHEARDSALTSGNLWRYWVMSSWDYIGSYWVILG